MKGVPEEKRSAAFRCAMVLVTPAGEVHEVSGSVQGVILDEPSGTGGFGYDPLFWLPEHEKTMAEIPIEEKNLISHRGKALSRILPVVKNLLG